MTATLLRRVERLEIVIPAPPPPPDDDDGWWDGLPEAVVRYVVALARECEARGRDPNSPEGGAWIHATHPVLGEVLAVARARQRLGPIPPLVEYQRAVLHHAWRTLRTLAADVRLAAGGEKNRPEVDDRTAWLGLIGTDNTDIGAIYGTRPGTFTTHWQATGTTSPETRTLVGFHAAELVLLQAREDGAA